MRRLLICALVMPACGSTMPTQATPLTDPPASAGHALVYHDSLRAVLLVNAGLGGMSSPSSSAKTVLWSWNGARWTAIDSAGPPVRNLGGVAYDAARNALVMYGGGYDQNLVYDDTWEWHPLRGWSKRSASGPGKRDHTDMAYDAATRRTILFGGQETTTTFPRETWAWDGSSWSVVTADGPAPRVHHTMAYDPIRRAVVLFGGSSQSGGLGDTWTLSGSAWTQMIPPRQPRSHARMSFGGTELMIVGGAENAPVLTMRDGTWMADGAGPGPRYLTAMAFDPARGVLVLFGGGDPSSDRLLADTWEYSTAAGWRRVR